ncbi:hypothetical protein HB13667_22855 [Pseudomonas putida]|uniref:Uncharacterized protein n=1 Tax=Pseudomonas putida TaxID=303 RepID=A0A0P7CZD9_PSEPU|nr:hypothetical protein HB13667_22855 [Pseudomonas putida]
MNECPKTAIVIDATASVEDGTVTDLAKRVNHGSGKHNATGTQTRVLTDHSGRMDDGSQHSASLLEQLLFGAADGVVANRHNHAFIGVNDSKQLRTAPDN